MSARPQEVRSGSRRRRLEGRAMPASSPGMPVIPIPGDGLRVTGCHGRSERGIMVDDCRAWCARICPRRAAAGPWPLPETRGYA